MLQRLGRRSVEVDGRDVTHVADVLPALRRGVVAAGCKVTEAVEEVLGRFELLLHRGLAADVIGDRALLRFGQVGEILLETALSLSVEPIEALGDDRAVLGGLIVRRADPFIDEVLDAELRRLLVAGIIRRRIRSVSDAAALRCLGVSVSGQSSPGA